MPYIQTMAGYVVTTIAVAVASILMGPACAPGSYDSRWMIHEVRLLLSAHEIAALDTLNTPEATALEAVLVDAPTPGDARRMTLATLTHWRRL
jgi:hypothetical protein